MRFLGEYLRKLWGSASDPSYYKEVLRSPLKRAFTFFLITFFFLACFSSFIWRVIEFPKVSRAVGSHIDGLVNKLPDTASLSYENGKLTTQNIPLPFEMHVSEEVQEMGFPEKLASIVGEDGRSDSFLTLQPTRVLVRLPPDDPNTLEIPYTDIFSGNFTLTPQMVRDNKQKVLEFLSTAATVSSLAVIPLLWLSLVLASLLTLAVLCLIAQSIAWLSGLRLTYKNTLKIGLHVLAIATLAEELIRMFLKNPPLSILPIAFFGMMGIIFWELKKRS